MLNNGLHAGDFLELHREIPDESVDLVFADPPFNIGYDYDVYKDRKSVDDCQMPERILERIIRACSNPGDAVLDPFAGSGTTLTVAKKLGRRYLGCELSSEYARQAQARIDVAEEGEPLKGDVSNA